MKNTKVCPKCGSKDIVIVPGSSGVLLQLTNLVPAAGFRGFVEVNRYLCCDCGFSEEWIDKPEDRMKIKKKFGSD